MMLMHKDRVPSNLAGDVFLSSLLSKPVWFRLAGAVGVMAALWLLIAWAVALP